MVRKRRPEYGGTCYQGGTAGSPSAWRSGVFTFEQPLQPASGRLFHEIPCTISKSTIFSVDQVHWVQSAADFEPTEEASRSKRRKRKPPQDQGMLCLGPDNKTTRAGKSALNRASLLRETSRFSRASPLSALKLNLSKLFRRESGIAIRQIKCL